MNYSERGPGLLGLIRWECYCLGLDPETITRENARRLLNANGYSGGNLDKSEPGDEMPARKIARAAWAEANAAKLAPMRIHWNAKLPIVPTIGPEGKD